MLAQLSTVKSRLQILDIDTTYDALLTNAIQALSARFDKETNRYATADQYSEMLKKAWSDIKTQGADDGPFSKNMRTFEFQPGEAGARG